MLHQRKSGTYMAKMEDFSRSLTETGTAPGCVTQEPPFRKYGLPAVSACVLAMRREKISEIKDVIGRTIRYRYENELLTEVEYPNQGIIRYRYTQEGYLREITDQNGQTYVHNEYDADGRVTRQLLSNGQEYIVLYDDANRVNTFLTPSSGQRIEYHYNREKLLTKTVYADGTYEERGYDEHQNCNYYKDRMGNALHRSFDSQGNLCKEERPGGLITEYAYDEAGNRSGNGTTAGVSGKCPTTAVETGFFSESGSVQTTGRKQHTPTTATGTCAPSGMPTGTR